MTKFLSYFKKEVNVHVDYLYEDGLQKPDTFNIYVIHHNKANMLTNLEWCELEKLINVLEKDKKAIQLWRTYGMGKETLDVPGWAKKKLAQKLRETQRDEEYKWKKATEVQRITYTQLSPSDRETDLFGNPLLISGIAGSGKTYVVKKMLPEWLRNSRRILLVDFRNEYKEAVEKNGGISVTGDDAHHKDNSLVRVHFGEDAMYHKHKIDLSFLSSAAEKFDYLIIDDATLVPQDSSSHSSLYDMCSSLIKENLHLKIILSLQSLSSLEEKERASLLNLFSHQLLFRQLAFDLPYKNNELRLLEVGEAILYIDKRPKKVIQF